MGGPRVRLTRTEIEAAGPGWLWDSDVPGLGVRVLASGVRSYVYRYGAGRRWATRRLTLGRHGEITLELARRLARRLSGAVAEGHDPAHELQQARGVLTLAQAWERYRAEYATLHKRESTQRRDAQCMVSVLAALGGQAVDRVTRGDVTRWHVSQSRTRAQANRGLAVLSHVYRLAAEVWALVPHGHNPTRGVRRYEERPRERYLSAEEWARVGAALDAEEHAASSKYPGFVPAAVSVLRVLALTGARLSEVAELRWADVDLERGAARLRRRKAGPLWLTLPGAAVDLLRALPRRRDAPWVFPGHRRGAHVSANGVESAWQRVRSRAGVPDVRVHDLRHSFASVLVGRGVSLPVIGGLLGHAKPSTTARYAHLADGPLRAAADGAAEAISAALAYGSESTCSASCPPDSVRVKR